MISNIKVNCIIQLLNDKNIILHKDVESKQYSNFQVIKQNGFVYIVFKKKGDNSNYHINITKISSQKQIKLALGVLHKIIKSKFLIKSSNINNLTCSYNFNRKIPLFLIYKHLANESFVKKLQFNPERFPGMFLSTFQNTVLIFASGKSVIIGGKNLNEVGQSILLLHKYLDKQINK